MSEKEFVLKSKKKRKNRFQIDAKQFLPFPVPLRIDDAIIWPLIRTNGFLRFSAIVNRKDNCVDVKDEASAVALYLLGYFGKGSLSRNAPVYDFFRDLKLKTIDTLSSSQHMNKEKPNSSDQSDDSSESSKHDLNKLHINSFLKAFNYIPDKRETIIALYGDQLNSNILPNTLVRSEKFNRRNNNEELLSEETCAIYDLFKGTLSETSSSEGLKLGFEEAYFLCYGLGVLSIFSDETKNELDLLQIWELFCHLYNSNDITEFPVLYAVYHYFRAKGWVVKSGLKYGCHFVLYKEGPPFYHSLFSVKIIKQLDNERQTALSWQYLVGFHRASQCVAKEPMLCYVFIPKNLDPQCYKSPKVIESFKIQTCLIERFVPSKKRENDECT
ncbi:tRNA-splicing endonuclease subunit Sen2-like protein [Dinothrombium tinctorium]|uniref:tRNA-splicing endonuclease subunit Sen2 n=1 Tax=Dinothrombium tinctorium TaxID=1965070 RepID=A0A3S3NRA7_9ACAR|nr:tRNA-splicing endonuclease subunit Sen2-like protein [Dinothrombium tinctorium]